MIPAIPNWLARMAVGTIAILLLDVPVASR